MEDVIKMRARRRCLGSEFIVGCVRLDFLIFFGFRDEDDLAFDIEYRNFREIGQSEFYSATSSIRICMWRIEYGYRFRRVNIVLSCCETFGGVYS